MGGLPAVVKYPSQMRMLMLLLSEISFPITIEFSNVRAEQINRSTCNEPQIVVCRAFVARTRVLWEAPIRSNPIQTAFMINS